MALSIWGRGRDEDLWDWGSFPSALSFPFSSVLAAPEQSSFARDVAAVANTQVDWRETSDSHVFKANLPGLAKEDVKVQVEDGRVLQISGERKREDVQSTDRWHRVERAQGSFLRRFRLPENAKLEEVKASMENGVLTVTVPKVAPRETRGVKSIEISN